MVKGWNSPEAREVGVGKDDEPEVEVPEGVVPVEGI